LNRRWLAVLTLVATAGAWGATFTLIKHTLDEIAPEPFIFLRFTLAGLVLTIVAASTRPLSSAVIGPAVLLGLFIFLGYWLQTRGLMVISPSRSAFLTGLFVVMVPFAEAVILKRRVPWTGWLGSLMAIIGTAALIGGFHARPSWGDVLTVIAAIVLSLHVVYSARYTTLHSATGLAAIQVLFVGLAAAVPSMFAPRPKLTGEIVVIIVFTALVTTALAFTAVMWAQAHLTATEAAVILAFEPVAASITSIVWDHERLTLSFAMGALLILAAMIISQLRVSANAE
jgi:drug/metabolite transporter (DMT)-like permease